MSFIRNTMIFHGRGNEEKEKAKEKEKEKRIDDDIMAEGVHRVESRIIVPHIVLRFERRGQKGAQVALRLVAVFRKQRCALTTRIVFWLQSHFGATCN